MKDEEGEGVGNVMLKEWEARDVTSQLCMNGAVLHIYIHTYNSS